MKAFLSLLGLAALACPVTAGCSCGYSVNRYELVQFEIC